MKMVILFFSMQIYHVKSFKCPIWLSIENRCPSQVNFFPCCTERKLFSNCLHLLLMSENSTSHKCELFHAKTGLKVVLEGYRRCPDSHDMSAYHHLYDLGRHIYKGAGGKPPGCTCWGHHGGLWSLSPPSSQTLCHWSNSITNLW